MDELDEFKDFDPREFWKKVNNDNEWTRLADPKKWTYMAPHSKFLASPHGKIWIFLSEPRTLLEISEHIHIHISLIKYLLDDLKSIYQVDVEAIRSKGIVRYRVPERILKKIKA